MKKALVTSLSVSLMALSSMAFAAGPAAQEPLQLSAEQMDSVTAGRNAGRTNAPGLQRQQNWLRNRATLSQINISPVTIVQIGNNNTAIVYSGNFSSIRQ